MSGGTEPTDQGPTVIGNLELYVGRGTARAAGQTVWLTPREAALLGVLAAAAGHVVARRRLAQDAWGPALGGREDGRVQECVSRVRAKLAVAAPSWRYIHTHRGRGYRLEPALRSPVRSRTRAR